MIIETLLDVHVDINTSYKAIKIIQKVQEIEELTKESKNIFDSSIREIPNYMDGGIDCYCFEVDEKYVLKRYSKESYERTVNTYKDAVQLGFDNALAKTPLMFTSEGGAVYILQERVHTVYNVGEDFVDEYLLNELVEKIKRICLFYRPYDLHRGNIGFNEKSELVILDWGHFSPTHETGNYNPKSQVQSEINGIMERNEWIKRKLQRPIEEDC